MIDSKILLIDDDPVNLELAQYLLEAAGLQVSVSDNAPSGLEIARRDPPSIILMDVQMPGMDGLTATRALKDDPTTAHIPVVALTANAMRGDRERCLAAGCVGHIAKPIDVADFAAAVSRFLPK